MKVTPGHYGLWWAALASILPAVGCATVSREEAALRPNLETGIARGHEPFFMPGTRTDAAVLLVHGFGGAPAEMRPVAEALNRRGFACRAILLPGHGVRPSDMDGVTWRDWRAATRAACIELKKKYGRLFYVGLSVGATIGLDLASEIEFDGLVLAAPYLRVRGRWYYLVEPEWAALHLSHAFKYLQRLPWTALEDRQARKRHVSFRHLPTSAMRSVVRYARVMRERLLSGDLADTASPILIFQPLEDGAVDPIGSQWVYDNIAGPDKKLVQLPRSGHVCTEDYDRDIVLAETLEFVTRLAGDTPTGTRQE